MFVDVINKKLEELQKELDNSKEDVSTELIEKLNDFITTVTANQQDLDVFDIDSVVDSVYESDEEKLKAVKDRLKVLSSMASDRRESGLSFFDFDQGQKEEILKFCEDAKAIVGALESKLNTESEKEKALKANMSDYHAMMSRINKHEKLAATDFDVILDMISSMDLKDRKSVLLDFISYNADAKETVVTDEEKENLDLDSEFKEIDDMLANDRNRIINAEESTEDDEIDLHVNIDDVLEAINKFEKDEYRNRGLKKLADRHKVELSKVFDVTATAGIIEFLKEKGIYERFSFDAILTILSYGTEESVRSTYDKLSNHDPNLINEDFVYQLPSLWVKPLKRKARNSGTGTPPEDLGPKTVQSLKANATKVYIEELFEKLDFFNSIGIDIVKDEKRATMALGRGLDYLKDELRVMQQYGLNYKKTSLFGNAAKVIAEKADVLIECGMLKPDYVKAEDGFRCCYANKYPVSAINRFHTGHMILLQDLFINDSKGDLDDLPCTRDDIFSVDKNGRFTGQIKGEFTENYMGYDLDKGQSNEDAELHKKRLDAFALAHDLVITNSSNMDGYNLMKSCIMYDADISTYTLESDFIKELDSKYLVPAREGTEPYLYNIDGNMISRYKVLRIYQSLLKFNLVSEYQLNEDDMRFFAVSYGTYLKSEDYQNLREIVKRGERRL